jgi:ketosteroid isomerase-like protein
MNRALACLLAMAALASCGTKVHDPELDRAAIENALRQWSIDFNAENVDGVCGLFAEDVVLVYPDSPDRGHQQFCDRMRGLFDDPTKTFSYEPPGIGEVLVDGDLATVRLNWTMTARDKTGRVLDTVEENGLDVFRRQPGGGWKIHVSHAFTQE